MASRVPIERLALSGARRAHLRGSSGDLCAFRVRLLVAPVRAPLPASSYILFLAGAQPESATLGRPYNPRLKPTRPLSVDRVAAARGLGAALGLSEQ